MAWAYERPDGGRGFAFTGYHEHDNLSDDNFRLLNAVAWVGTVQYVRTIKPKAIRRLFMTFLNDDVVPYGRNIGGES